MLWGFFYSFGTAPVSTGRVKNRGDTSKEIYYQSLT